MYLELQRRQRIFNTKIVTNNAERLDRDLFYRIAQITLILSFLSLLILSGSIFFVIQGTTRLKAETLIRSQSFLVNVFFLEIISFSLSSSGSYRKDMEESARYSRKNARGRR